MTPRLINFLLGVLVVAIAFLGGFAYGKSTRATAHPVVIEWAV